MTLQIVIVASFDTQHSRDLSLLANLTNVTAELCYTVVNSWLLYLLFSGQHIQWTSIT